MPPHTTKRRATTYLETKKQNCQKIAPCGSLATKVLKEETFIQTSRRGRDGQLAGRVLPARQRLEDQVVPHLCVAKLGRIIGERDTPHNPGFQYQEIKPQNL